MRKYTTKQKFRQVSATRRLTVKHDQLEVNENDKKNTVVTLLVTTCTNVIIASHAVAE